MSFFKGNKRGPADPIITVSAETRATVSDRVEFKSQIVQFEADPNSDQIALITLQTPKTPHMHAKRAWY